ncbi:hypothetical protein SODALDRAFT_361706 [Sodiomyces alkalinus F11]|uniref:Uncharacterized protein n=1 Tax=Sodiomyces alkalinus (strain CBS 110278 / VKM F-3762 / F11) TaxID=1314773 RepID=A0A3N2PQY3_SODAK|nr:hypothetical protein SODALDRAFT_361706 [Sodiomyces alkalinus F11]ROT36880.1 hypothetical protein SODALDRAFT_361706 [Sodiomyces alkalinus F11]
MQSPFAADLEHPTSSGPKCTSKRVAPKFPKDPPPYVSRNLTFFLEKERFVHFVLPQTKPQQRAPTASYQIMETLQLAQMLADLSSLNAAEPDAAAALVTANKTIEKTEKQHQTQFPTDQQQQQQYQHSLAARHLSDDPSRISPPSQGHSRHHSRSGTGHNTPALFDKFGRRILTSPPLTRTNSSPGSGSGTPRRGSDVEEPPAAAGSGDVDRASTLMTLYEIRTKLKQQDNRSLVKAREKIAELAARQQAQAQKEGENGQGSRYTYPK